jgi:RNA 2',3'-cyclic 3'-phosphodiesterase
MKGGVETKRLFVAIDPSDGVRARVREALPRAKALAPRARWVDPDGMHVTLAFLGDIAVHEIGNLTAAMGEAASRHAPIELRFTGAGTFGGRRPRVLWIGVDGEIEALREAHRDLSSALAPFGYRHDHPELTAHLTLARAGDRAGDPSLLACASALLGQDFGPTRADAWVLYESQRSSRGATYTAVARLPLALR